MARKPVNRRLEKKHAVELKPAEPAEIIGLQGVDPATGKVVFSLPGTLKELVGTDNPHVAKRLMEQILKAAPKLNDLPETAAEVGAMLSELRPTTTLEAMLCVQMTAVHNHTMRLLAAAANSNEHFRPEESRALALMKLFREQIDTLRILQGKSRVQRVVVERVSVTAGGQAVVGMVGGPGVDFKKRP